MIDINKLKKVPPIDNPAPVFRKSDVAWSVVFDCVASQFEKEEKPQYGICAVIFNSKFLGLDQRGRMTDYINGLLGSRMYLNSWLEVYNGFNRPRRHSELYAYRAAWARHLAAQFRSKGL